MNALAQIRELLRRVAAASLADRFALADVCPTDATRFLVAFGQCLDRGLVERVLDGPHRWFYTLTPAGRACAAGAPFPWVKAKADP